MSEALRIMAVNGSPRKNGTMHQLLQAFLEGASSSGPEVETVMVDLYDLQFTGCRECYLCKVKGGRKYGTCGYRDGLKDVLDRARACDGIAFGAPVFLGDFAAQGKAFLERLLFPYILT